MNQAIIRNWNQRVQPEDIVYHLGDFCFRGGDEGGKTKAQQWEALLNGKVIHLLGNHDHNNGVKGGLEAAIVRFHDLEAMLVHVPPEVKPAIPDFCDLVLCGHVHELWKHKFVEDVPVINMSVDVWKFMPVVSDEVRVYYDRIMKEKKEATK